MLMHAGSRLECLARQHLWSRGLDYVHGTGHGVGSFLNVHEGAYGKYFLLGSYFYEYDSFCVRFMNAEPGYLVY